MATSKVSRLTYADFEQLPESALKHELFDGELVVSPSPIRVHERVVRNLLFALQAAIPPDCEMFFSRFDWVIDNHNVYEPDLLVAGRADTTEKNLPVPPRLAVEVLSPSNRAHDLVRKRNAYARGGLAHCWIVDPEVPSILVLELVDGSFVERQVAKGDEVLSVERPFAVSICPGELVV